MDFETCEVSFDCVMPSAIFFNPNIEPGAIRCYAMIRNLTKMNGYCYATNKYLAELLSCGLATLKNWISSLQTEGFIKIEHVANFEKDSRHIYISDKFKKCFRRLKNEPPLARNLATRGQKSSHIIEEYPKESDLKVREEAQAPPLRPFKYKRVIMSQDQLNALLKDFGKVKTDEMMDRLDEYSDINPKRFKQYACHATVVRKWIREDEAQKPQEKKSQAVGEKTPAEIEADNRTWKTSMEKILWPYIKEGKIYISHDYLEFIGHTFKTRENVQDKNFVSKCQNCLKMLGIMV